MPRSATGRAPRSAPLRRRPRTPRRSTAAREAGWVQTAPVVRRPRLDSLTQRRARVRCAREAHVRGPPNYSGRKFCRSCAFLQELAEFLERVSIAAGGGVGTDL